MNGRTATTDQEVGGSNPSGRADKCPVAIGSSGQDRIMRHLYGHALEEFPRMRQQAIDQRKGALRLFDDTEFGGEVVEYCYEPPWPPYGAEGWFDRQIAACTRMPY